MKNKDHSYIEYIAVIITALLYNCKYNLNHN